MMEKCPCNSQKDYSDCCAPFLETAAKPLTAEQLMRARYTAYTKNNIDFIINTVHPSTRAESDRKTVASWVNEAIWTRLEVLSTQKGGVEDEVGKVVFKAHYKNGNQLKIHHEDSTFQKENGEWFYLTGEFPKATNLTTAKIGRNDVCYCGSGKKFKKCCANK